MLGNGRVPRGRREEVYQGLAHTQRREKSDDRNALRQRGICWFAVELYCTLYRILPYPLVFFSTTANTVSCEPGLINEYRGLRPIQAICRSCVFCMPLHGLKSPVTPLGVAGIIKAIFVKAPFPNRSKKGGRNLARCAGGMVMQIKEYQTIVQRLEEVSSRHCCCYCAVHSASLTTVSTL